MHESAQGSIVYILFYMTIHMYTYMYTLFTVLLVYSDKLTVYDKKLQNKKKQKKTPTTIASEAN